MGSFTPHVGKCRNRIVREVMLDIEMPLLHVRPSHLGRNSDHTQRELGGAPLAFDVRVPLNLNVWTAVASGGEFSE